MRNLAVIVSIVLAGVGCKKSGGGGGWLVGSSALMENVSEDGQRVRGYPLAADVQLNGIACRYAGEAWVVGDRGTLLYTNDGGNTWTPEAVPATGALRAVATQDAGPVFVVGDGAFLVTTDTGATWKQLGDGTVSFRAVAAAQEGSTVLAISEDGGIWAVGTDLARETTIAGAHAVAISPDGGTAMIAGAGLWQSLDGGASWTQLAVDPSLVFDDIRITDDGAVAVGAGGAIAHVDASGTVTVQHVGTADLHALHIGEDAEATGFAAGEGGQVLVTHDSGATWALGPNLGRTVYGVDEIGIAHR